MKNPTLLLALLLCMLLAGPTACGDADDDAGDAPAATATTASEETKPDESATSRPRPPAPQPRAKEQSPQRKALRAALEKPDLVSRVTALVELLPTLGPDAIPAVRESLGDFTNKLGALGSAEYALLLDFWSSHDPEAAARFMLAESPYGFRLANSAQPIRAWARKDPHAAADAFARLLDRAGRVAEVVETGLVWGWFESGEPGLEDFIAGLAEGPIRQRAISLYARLLIRRDGTEAAQRWAESVPPTDPKYKFAVFRQTAIALALEDLPAAIAWCDEQCEGPFGRGMRPLVSRYFGEADGEAAMEWLSHAPPGPDMHLSVTRAFGGWWAVDSDAARAWMEDRREEGFPEYLVPAVGVYAGILAREVGEEGVEWALDIADPEARVATLLNVARTWRAVDRSAADAWLESSPLDEEQRERVRNPPRGPAFELDEETKQMLRERQGNALAEDE